MHISIKEGRKKRKECQLWKWKRKKEKKIKLIQSSPKSGGEGRKKGRKLVFTLLVEQLPGKKRGGGGGSFAYYIFDVTTDKRRRGKTLDDAS